MPLLLEASKLGIVTKYNFHCGKRTGVFYKHAFRAFLHGLCSVELMALLVLFLELSLELKIF